MTLAAVAGFGIGLVFGVVAGELLGEVNSTRVKEAVLRLRPGDVEVGTDPDQLAVDLQQALRNNPTTRDLDLSVGILGEGLVEVSGSAPDERTRELAGALLNSVRGTERVVNRILVPGVDLPAKPRRSARGT